ncbi:putative carbohydrate sulfotransferase 15 [Apostichopus japonicus]|uniref:Putative carbohydrate sulfotransferase 15 n=1 Tax=Stichopus japonicus TaxID=307972 RepID=A0A2G8L2A1_STIJA|nr:putative carbohydrate sulfotransferase 15 [Apostichopus japonicus]
MVQLMAPEISNFIGKERLKNYKNPCWARTPLSISCVPYFFLLGVTKCGTSDIYEKLVKHPQIVDGVKKESHWWTQRRLGRPSVASFEKELKRGVQFLGVPNRIQEKSMKVIGDGSPSTFWDNHNWRSIFPNHPEDRLTSMYSGYNFFTSRHSPEVFHEKVVERLAIFNKCLSVNSLRACAYQDILTFSPVGRDKPAMQLRMGIYHVFLQDWLEVYPNEQLFVLELTDWQQNCLPLLRQLYHFLELEPLPESRLAQFCKAPARNKAKHRTKPMLDKTRLLLEEFYKPYNKKLYEILKDQKFNWDYT